MRPNVEEESECCLYTIIYRLTWEGRILDVGTTVNDLKENELDEEDDTRHGESPHTEVSENVFNFVKDAFDN